MLFLTGRGDHAVAGAAGMPPNGVPLATACGFYANQPNPEWDTIAFGPFGYFFESAPVTPELPPGRLAHTGGLRIAPEDAAFCQFVEHDITAAVERHAILAPPPGDDPRPLPRIMVLGTLANLRTGRLDLDSLYGGAAVQGGFAAHGAECWLRHPRRRARLWLDEAEAEAGIADPTSRNPTTDVLRLGRLQDSGALSPVEIANLPVELQQMFVDPPRPGPPVLNRARAILGDGRNAGSRDLRRLHVALARLHNLTVDLAPALGGPEERDSAACFAFARRLIRWHYQWLILNDLLPRLTCPDILTRVLAAGAPLYAGLLADVGGRDRAQMPLPLEVAGAVLPFLAERGRLGARLIRRGHRLNLASAQAAQRALALRGIALPALCESELAAGPLGAWLAAADLCQMTPKVFYLQQEAQSQGGGYRLGALGSRLLSETMAGLVLHNPDSYWHAPGHPTGAWHPRHGVRPGGRLIDSIGVLHEATVA